MSHYPYQPSDWVAEELKQMRSHIGARIECHLRNKGITHIGTITAVGDYSFALTTDEDIVSLTPQEVEWWDFLPQETAVDKEFLEDFFRTMRQIDTRIGIEGVDVELLREVYAKCLEFRSEYRRNIIPIVLDK